MSGVARQLFVVFRKELKESVRDRRALLAIVIGVLVGPLVIAFMVNRIADRQRAAETVRIPVAGADHAPALVQWLRQQPGVTIETPDGSPERLVRDGREDLVLIVPDDFAERFRVSRAAPVKLVSDSSRDSAAPRVRRVRQLLQAYSAQIGALRLIAHGVSPQVATAVRVDDVEVATPQQRASGILNFLGLFMILSALTGGMQVATDSTAGERERGSLESLLLNPVPRSALAGGKWLAATLVALVAVTLTMAVTVGLLKMVMAPDIGIRVAIGPLQVATLALAALSLCPFATALQTLVGTYSRSFKEAQSYISVLMTLPVMGIALAGALYPMQNQLWMYAVPMLGQYTLVTNTFAGTVPGPAAFVLAAGVSLLATVVMMAVTTRLFSSERIIFGR